MSDVDFTSTARSPLCMMPMDGDDAKGLLLAGIDTLGHVRALLRTLAEHTDRGELLIVDTATGAIGHAIALLTESLALSRAA